MIPLSYSEFMKLSSRERVRHEKAMNNLELRLRRFQEICPHKNTRFTGLNADKDSATVCILCNKEV